MTCFYLFIFLWHINRRFTSHITNMSFFWWLHLFLEPFKDSKDPPSFGERQGPKCLMLLRRVGNCTTDGSYCSRVLQECTGMEYLQNNQGALAHQPSSLSLGCSRMLQLLWRNMWFALVLCRGMCILGWGELNTPSYACVSWQLSFFLTFQKADLQGSCRHAQNLLEEVEKRNKETHLLFSLTLFLSSVVGSDP